MFALTVTGLSVRAAAIDWPTYGFNLERTGENPFETVLTPATAAGLRPRWDFNLGAIVIMQPVLAAGVRVNGSVRDLVFVGDEHGELYAIDAASGSEVWHRNLGVQQTRCDDMPDGKFGVSGSPAIDRGNNRLFVAAADGQMYALDLSTGATLPGWPVVVTAFPAQEHVWSAITLNSGIAYAETASFCDFPPYHGKTLAIDINHHQAVASFFPAGRFNGGAIWGSGGVSIDSATGHLFTATGNALTHPQNYLYSEDVVELGPGLQVLGANYPGLVGEDVDFGSTPVLYQTPGGPPLATAKNKSGVLVTYKRGHISEGPTQRLQVADVHDDEFIGLVAWSDKTHLLYVSNSSDSNSGEIRHGMVAFSVDTNGQLRLAWQKTVGLNPGLVSSPTVAGGVVYYGDGLGNQVLAFDAESGRLLWSSGATIDSGVFATPMVVNGQLYVAAWNGHLYAFGL